MTGEIVVIIGLISIISSLFFTEERDPTTILLSAIGRFIGVCVAILIVKGIWLLMKMPW